MDAGVKGAFRPRKVDPVRTERNENWEPPQALLAGVLNSSHDGIMAFRSIRDEGAQIVDFEWMVVNPAAERIVGRSASELVGERLLVEMPGNAETGLFDRYVEVVESGRPYTVEHRYDHEGLDSWFLTTAVRLDDGFTVTFRDVTQHKQLQAALEHQALHDPLTGLPNRLLLESRIAHALDRLQRGAVSLAVLFIDLDRFKVLNDSLGHTAGDALLSEFGRRLRDVARPGDTIARFGGDEFVVLCEDLLNDYDADRVARRFLEVTAAPIEIQGREISITASVGVATAHASDVDPTSLIRDADAAMYRAKANGRARVEFFDAALRSEVVARLDIEVELRHAISHGELSVLYQPIVSVSDQRIVAVEALVRWQHPEHGLLAPDRFLPIAEETGLVVPLGAWVLEEAIAQFAHWRESLGDQAPRSVCVNLAAAQLAMPSLVDVVAEALARAGVEPEALCLEVTETALIRDPVTAEMTLHALAARGVQIALDDFGTGYSPLSYLQRFPVDFIKIDRSFIDGLGHSTGDRAVVAAVIALATTLGKTTVAEGIETARQLDVLQELGGGLMQGYYFSPPISSEELTAMIIDTSPQPDGSSPHRAPVDEVWPRSG